MRGRRRNMGDRRVIHLVDDEESIRKAASFALKTAGYDVVTYASGVEFLKEATSAAVGCLIIDLSRPEMAGLAVPAALAAHGGTMPETGRASGGKRVCQTVCRTGD